MSVKRYIIGVISDQGCLAGQRYYTTTWQSDDAKDLVKRLLEHGYDFGGGNVDDEGDAVPEFVDEIVERLSKEGYWDAGDGSYPLFMVDTQKIDDSELVHAY